jgi:hypothetical protein
MNARGQYGNANRRVRRTDTEARTGQAPFDARLSARARAIRAVFDMYSRRGGRAPYYVYTEVNGVVDKRSATTVEEANSIFAALERSLGEVYVSIFDPTDPRWPGPAFEVYHPLPQAQAPIAGYPMVGITLYHSVGDRLEAVKQMDLDWTALWQNLAVQVGILTPDPKSSSGFHYTTQAELDKLAPDPKKVTWFKSIAKPRFDAWLAFRREQLGTDLTFGGDYVAWTERFKTNWDVYEGWMKKLETLKAEAKNQGFMIEAPAVTPLPTTVWADVAHTVEKGAGAVAGGLGDVWSIVKYGAVAVIGIGAIVALSSVAQNLRRGKDPAEKYVELIRQRGGRALPAPARLALPPGGA